MIPCYICGKDIGGSWAAGFPPAPDSQKVGLCREHDSEENRHKAFAAWQQLLNTDIAIDLKLHEGEMQAPKELAVQFMDGGSKVFSCLHFGLADNNILEITESSGEKIFYPLRHVRSYHLL